MFLSNILKIATNTLEKFAKKMPGSAKFEAILQESHVTFSLTLNCFKDLEVQKEKFITVSFNENTDKVFYSKKEYQELLENPDNYLEKNKMFFNSYKTAKTYGCQQIDIPKILQNILKKWININPTHTLLFDVNMNPLSSVKLNQRINKIFDKKVSVNALRHSYLTDKYSQHSQVDKELSKDMSEMGSSRGMADTYIKLN
jgi:guanylate kinase